MGSTAERTGPRIGDGTRLADEIQAFLDRLGDKDVPEEVARRGQVVMTAIGQAAEDAAQRAAEAWRDSRPLRREMRRQAERQGREVGRWSRQLWRREIQPGLRRAWTRRAAALGLAGAAVPAGKQLFDQAASDLGIRQRDERHWGAFFAGILIGGLAGLLAAMLTAPKPGREVRDELAARARTAAESAGEWVRIPRPEDDGETTVAETSEVEAES